MELHLEKYKGGKRDYETYKVLNITKITENSDLLLVDESKISFSYVEEGVNSNNVFFKIYKVQFIISCDIEIAKNILVAFFVDMNGELTPYILSELPNHYVQTETGRFLLIDYKNYCEICGFTNEKVMSLSDYIESKKNGNSDPNSLLKYEDKYYNADSAGDIYDKIGGISQN